MTNRELIEQLRAQGYTDAQILDTLFPPGQDARPDQDGEGQGEEDLPADQDENEEGEGSSQDFDDQPEPGSDHDEGQSPDSSDRDEGEPGEEGGENDPTQDPDEQPPDAPAENEGYGGNSLPQGYVPPAPTVSDLGEAYRALQRWTKAMLGGRQTSSRRDAAKLCVRMVSRASLQHTHKREQTRKRLLVSVDVSSSCSSVATTYIRVARALAAVEKRLAILIHSNGVPLSLDVDGRIETKRILAVNEGMVQRGHVRVERELAAMRSGPRATYSYTANMADEGTNLDRLWKILNGLNLQGVLHLGDSDAIQYIAHLSRHANVCWVQRIQERIHPCKPAKRLSEHGVIAVRGWPDVKDYSNEAEIRATWKGIDSLPTR